MAAITHRLLRCRPVQGHQPSPLRHFSSSDTSPPSEPESQPPSPSQKSFSSYFTDVKASLQNRPQTLRESSSNPPQNRPQPPRETPSLPTPPPPRFAYLDEIRRNLSEYRRRSAPGPPHPGTAPTYPTPGASSGPPVSLQELYNRHTPPNNEDFSAVGGLNPPVRPSLRPIRDSINHLRSSPARNQSNFQAETDDQLSLARFKESLKLKPGEKTNHGSPIIGGGDGLTSLFEKEMDKNRDDHVRPTPAMRTQFVRMYDYSELGAKLQKLRPEKKKGNWFSLHELNERLANLRLIEEKESTADIGGFPVWDLKESIRKLSKGEQHDAKKRNTQKLDILSQIGGTPSFMLSPPKDDLVEKYFHPDNMSSAEKLKLELKKVREEFKMTESDCGSARVQVAQLSTKIKHLSTVLKKKDKHSRRGLEAMLDRRRKLLKYLRRTDWDSYCLVLSKFGIRDNNPDIKPAHKNKA